MDTIKYKTKNVDVRRYKQYYTLKIRSVLPFCTAAALTFLHFCTNIHKSYITCTQVQVFYTTLHFLEIFTAHSALLHCAVRTLVDFSNSAKSQLDHMQQSYQCNCSAKCAGVPKPVSRATYFRHAKYRPLQGIFDERLAEVIQGNSTTASSVDCNATLGQPSSKKSVKRRRVEEDSDSEESVKNTTLLMVRSSLTSGLQ
jgi:hypothetical protein